MKIFGHLNKKRRNIYFKVIKTNKKDNIRIVLGIQNKDVYERLLRKDLTLEKKIQYCQAVEAAEQNRKELEQSMDKDKVWNIEVKRKSKGMASNKVNRNNSELNINNKDKNVNYKTNETKSYRDNEK